MITFKPAQKGKLIKEGMILPGKSLREPAWDATFLTDQTETKQASGWPAKRQPQ